MKKYLVLLTLTVIALGQYGCKKELNALPNDALVEGNVITNQQTANTALNGVYYRFANATAIQTNWLENEIDAGFVTGFLDDGGNTANETKNNLNNSSFSDEKWNTNYTIINAANGVIEGVNKLNSSMFTNGRKQQILAESKFMRAWAHYKLLSWFGQWWDINSSYGVVLRSSFITSSNILQARANVKSSYDFILSDVNYAIDSAATTSSNVYVNKYTAMALKMRILLNRKQPGDYDQVVALANAIIASKAYTLEPNLKDIFYTKGLASSEVMLGVKPQAGQESYYFNTSGTYVYRSSYYVATDLLNNLLNGDPRQAWIIGNAGRTDKGFYFIKYVTPSLTTTTISEVAYAFRLSEVYLMKAEALASSGALIDARKALTEVMQHAGVTDFTAVNNATGVELQKQIYYEWVKNFVGEDDMYYWALLRFDLKVITDQLRPTIKSKDQYILPIPHNEFLNNPLIGDQNPSYQR